MPWVAVARSSCPCWRTIRSKSMRCTIRPLPGMLAQAATCAAKPRHVPATRLRGGYYIFLDSTDPLEQLFGIIRDLHGPGTQVDCIQFEERATAAMSIAAIYSRHPEWQRGSRRLTGSLDHMNPRAWLL